MKPPLPTPPEEFNADERAAYRQGAANMARMLGSHAMAVGGMAEDDVGSDDRDETCPDCGVEYVDGFGGRLCPRCGVSA